MSLKKLSSKKIILALSFSAFLIIFAVYLKQILATSPANQIKEKKKVVQLKSPGLSAGKILKDSTNTLLITTTEKNAPKGPKTITEATARSIVLAYITAKQKGESTKEIEKLLQNMSDDILKIDYTRYESDKLHIAKNMSKPKYKRAIAKSIAPLSKIPEYELDTIAKIIKNDDQKARQTLKTDIKLYTKTIENLLNSEVPKNAIVPHLALVNAYSKLVASFQLVDKSKDDIILVYPSLRMFLEADSEIYDAFDALKDYVEIK